MVGWSSLGGRSIGTMGVVVLLGSCGAKPEATVQSDPSLDAFMAVVAQGDFHKIVRDGKELFAPGKVAVDHTSRFGRFPAERLPNGQIRYTLNEFHGEAGAGAVTLTLEAVSGKVVKFDHVEATLD